MNLSKIREIKRIGRKQTFDITVENNHNFLCNNHIIHNCDYIGEIKIVLLNTSNTHQFVINNGDRIAQGIVNKIEHISFNNVTELKATERGDNGFGSTGK